MKEQHRILLAFLLITLIAVFFYSRSTQKFPPIPENSPDREFYDVIQPQEEEEVASSLPLLPSIGEEREVVVETDLYRIVLSTRGGTIQSVELKNYRGWEWDTVEKAWKLKEWVELIPAGGGALGLSLGNEMDLSDVIFNVDQEELVFYRPGEVGSLQFSLTLPSGEKLVKTYSFRQGSYLIGLEWEGGMRERETLSWGSGLRTTEKGKTKRENGVIQPNDPKEDLQNFASVVLMGGELLRFTRKETKREVFDPIELESKSGPVAWAGVRTKYFIAALIPLEGEVEGFSAHQVGLKKLSVSLTTRTTSRVRYDIYLGPIDYDQLQRLGVGLEKVVDLGWSWIRPIAKGILYLLKFLHRVLPGHNYGVVIILFSGMMMLVFFPLTYRGLRATQAMQKLQPKIAQIRERYKKDSQRMNRETMALYKKNKVNPMGGCLPLVFQMPVFFGLYSVLRSTLEIRGASFLWLTDLSQADPFYVLPIVMGGTMFLQQRFTATSQDPRQKMMMWMMPIFMTFIFLNFPAGLVLYWLTYNILSTIQHLLIRKREKEEEVTP